MKPHRFDATSLICGVVFAVVAGVYLTSAATASYVDIRWLLPLALIGLGVAGVAGAVTTATRQQRAATVDAPPPAVATSVVEPSVDAGEPGEADGRTDE